VLDTNALLVPYRTGPEILKQITSTYQRLIAEKRLVIPGQVAREFAKNRGDKLKELHEQLLNHKSSIHPIEPVHHPLVEAASAYRSALEIAETTNRAIKEYCKQIDQLVVILRSWYWNDPVSELYRSLFKKEVLFDPPFEQEQIRRELEQRYRHKIPPGYKDASKPDSGIGDLLIWKTILGQGTERKCPCVLVSGETKPDWVIRSMDHALYPRYELVDEYRRASEGGAFHILRFSALLELYGASPQIVQEVSSQEHRNQTSHAPISAESESMARIHAWLKHVYLGCRVLEPPPGDPCDLRVRCADRMQIGVAILRRGNFSRNLEAWYGNACAYLKPVGRYDKFHAIAILRTARPVWPPLPLTKAVAQKHQISLSVARLDPNGRISAIRQILEC
jgi:hypothetical protein